MDPSFRDRRAEWQGGAGGAEPGAPGGASASTARANAADRPMIATVIPPCSISIWVRLDAGVAAARATSSARAATPG